MDQKDSSAPQYGYSRRRVLIMSGGAVLSAVVIAACGDDSGSAMTTGGAGTTGGAATTGGAGTTAAGAAAGANAATFGGGGGDGTVKIGFTAPLTGPLAGFGEANDFILAQINDLVADGIMLGDKSFTVEIITKDVEWNSDTAATRAGEAILDENVDMMIAIATPEMINPVADQCEANGVPCLSTLAPWQPYFLGRGGDPATGFDWTYHFFWGADQLVGVFVEMWDSVQTNKKIGLLCPNDPDGNALADPKLAPRRGHSGRLHRRRSRPLPGAQRRLLEHHRSVQGRRRRDRRRHPAASRLRDLLDPGGAAGLPSQARDDGEGGALPLRGRGARRPRRRPRQRDLVDARPSLQELADR